MKGSHWRFRQQWQPASVMSLTSELVSRICGLPRWASTPTDSTPVHPNTSSAHSLSSPFSRLLVGSLDEDRPGSGDQGSPAKFKVDPSRQHQGRGPHWAADSSILPQPTSLDFDFLYLWTVNDTAPLWEGMWMPWRCTTSQAATSQKGQTKAPRNTLP